MKEKILAGIDNIKIDIAKSVLEELEIQKNCKKMLPKIKEYFSQALDQYADWKIKECIKDIEDDIDYDGEIYSTEYRNGQERAIEIIKNK